MTDFLGDPAVFLQRLVFQIPALLIAVTVHELAHALVADRLGDPTARLLGRITLNPLPHIDPLGALRRARASGRAVRRVHSSVPRVLRGDPVDRRPALSVGRPVHEHPRPLVHLSNSGQSKAPGPFGPGAPELPRQRPTLPRRYQRSTISPGGLNFRVRDGNGCGPSGNATGNLASIEYVDSRVQPSDVEVMSATWSSRTAD